MCSDNNANADTNTDTNSYSDTDAHSPAGKRNDIGRPYNERDPTHYKFHSDTSWSDDCCAGQWECDGKPNYDGRDGSRRQYCD
jgi:hypothetical protein